eukprot:IDg9563t1
MRQSALWPPPCGSGRKYALCIADRAAKAMAVPKDRRWYRNMRQVRVWWAIFHPQHALFESAFNIERTHSSMRRTTVICFSVPIGHHPGHMFAISDCLRPSCLAWALQQDSIYMISCYETRISDASMFLDKVIREYGSFAYGATSRPSFESVALPAQSLLEYDEFLIGLAPASAV